MKKSSMIDRPEAIVDTTRRDKAERRAAPIRAQIDSHVPEERIKSAPRPPKK